MRSLSPYLAGASLCLQVALASLAAAEDGAHTVSAQDSGAEPRAEASAAGSAAEFQKSLDKLLDAIRQLSRGDSNFDETSSQALGLLSQLQDLYDGEVGDEKEKTGEQIRQLEAALKNLYAQGPPPSASVPPDSLGTEVPSQAPSRSAQGSIPSAPEVQMSPRAASPQDEAPERAPPATTAHSPPPTLPLSLPPTSPRSAPIDGNSSSVPNSTDRVSAPNDRFSEGVIGASPPTSVFTDDVFHLDEDVKRAPPERPPARSLTPPSDVPQGFTPAIIKRREPLPPGSDSPTTPESPSVKVGTEPASAPSPATDNLTFIAPAIVPEDGPAASLPSGSWIEGDGSPPPQSSAAPSATTAAPLTPIGASLSETIGAFNPPPDLGGPETVGAPSSVLPTASLDRAPASFTTSRLPATDLTQFMQQAPRSDEPPPNDTTGKTLLELLR